MKKIQTVFYSLYAISTVLFYSCSTKQDGTDKLDLKQMKDYAYLGEIHNDIMSYANEHFEIEESIVTQQEALEYVGSWTASHINTITSFAKSSWIQEFNVYSNNIDAQDLRLRLIPCKTRSLREIKLEDIESNNLALDEVLFIAKEYKMIDDFEFVKFRELADKLILNEQGLLSNAELKQYVLSVVAEWENQTYDKQSEYGQTLGMTLAVSMASLEYWEENYGTIGTRAIPVWIGCDIAGAAIGGLTNIARNIYRDQPVTFLGVADGVLIGAATGSIGLVGKVGKWISSLF